jgi:FdhD protein
MHIYVLVARATPTVAAIRMAERYGITLLGYVRGEEGIFYTGLERIEVSG